MFNEANSANLASAGATKRQIATLRNHMFEVGDRLASGHKDVTEIARERKTVSVFALERELQNLDQFKQSHDDIGLRLSTVQSTLEALRASASQVSLGVLSTLEDQSAKSFQSVARNANGALDSIVSSLNQSVAGQTLFAGASLSSSAVVGSQQIIADVASILSSSPNVASAQSNVDFYFNDPAGGFALNSYLGSVSNGPSVEIASGQYISQDVRVDHPAIKETIQNLAVMAAVANGAVSSVSDQKTLLSAFAGKNLNTNQAIILLQQDIGHDQEVLDQVSASNASRQATIEVAKNKITAVDVFEEAAKFEELQVQLETSYNVLVRLSSLNLSNFLR